MTDENQLHTESSRGDQAKLLLENELLVEAKELITANLHDKWESTTASQSADREYIHQQLKAFNEVFRHLQSVMQTGQMAKQTLKERIEQWKNR